MTRHKALLLNAANMAAYPVYPYAFIQVPALARRAGVEVACQDMLGIAPPDWGRTLQALIERHRPEAILITLRNTDTLNARDYEPDGSEAAEGGPYFPIERTRELIMAVRAVSDLKIAVGGFGFSLLPNGLMAYLRPDFGVFGGGDGFFERFADVLEGKLDETPNLLYFRDRRLAANPREFYPPLAEAEYTPQAIAAMKAFYEAFPSPGFLGAPVEVLRGCCHSCVFCSEPHVQGARVRYRDLSAVMSDVELLASHGVTRIYAISTELNPEGNQFVLELADRIRSYNEARPPDARVTWYGANYLLDFGPAEFERLSRSGFTGGWFDLTALDDDNARAMRTPYRVERVVPCLKAYAGFKAGPAKPPGAAEDQAENRPTRWTMFLGNPATTLATIRATLRVANREGLPELFDDCSITSSTRVFDYEQPGPDTLAVTYSVTAGLGRIAYHQLLPSFAYPPALLAVFGSAAEISGLFDHLAATYLSTRYRATRDWPGFLRRWATAESVAAWAAALPGLGRGALPEPEALRELFAREAGEGPAQQIVESLLRAGLAAFPDIVAALGLPTATDSLEQLTSYELAVSLFRQWRGEQELFDALAERARPVLSPALQACLAFCVRALLYRSSVILRPDYRALFHDAAG